MDAHSTIIGLQGKVILMKWKEQRVSHSEIGIVNDE